MDFSTRITRTPVPFDAERGQVAAALFPDADPALSRLIEGAAGSSPHLSALIHREADWLPSSLDLGDVAEVMGGYGPTTVNLHDVFHVVEDGVVTDIWPVTPRGPGRP